MHQPTVSIYFVNAALQNLLHDPSTARRLLDRNKIPPALLENPDARVPGENFSNLLRDIMLETGDEQMGHGAAPQPLGSWATMTQLCISADTLGEALRRMARFYRLIPWGIHTHLQVAEDESALVMVADNPHDISNYLFESFLFYVYRFSNWLINRQIPLKGVDFCFASPPHRVEYQQLFLTTRFRFEEENCRLRFPGRFLDEPVQQDSHSLKEFLEHTNLAMVNQTHLPQSWRNRVQKLLLERLDENPGISDIAALLNIHPHTLRNRLREEGVMFRELKDHLRCELAIDLLRERHTGVEATARRLGYSETSALSRAFKQWMGMSPAEYRRYYQRR